MVERMYGDVDVVELLAKRSRLEARAALAVAELDRSGSWAVDGAVSVIQWLVAFARLAADDARRLLTLGERLIELPVTRSEVEAGALSLGQARAIAVNVPSELVDTFRDIEPKLVPTLLPLSAGQVSFVMQRWRAHAQAAAEDSAASELPQRSLHRSPLPDGRWRLDADLDNEAGQLVASAIARATSPTVEGEPTRSPAQRRADALTDVCRFFLDHGDESIAPRTRPHLDIVVTVDAIKRCLPGELLDGGTLDGPTLRRLACDADIHRVIAGPHSAILDYGRRRRLVSDSQRRALNVRDRHCRFPGCSRPVAWCEAHHIIEWPDGGKTTLENLALLCSRHHHLIHLPDWQFSLASDGTLTVMTPSGRGLHTRPPPWPEFDSTALPLSA